MNTSTSNIYQTMPKQAMFQLILQQSYENMHSFRVTFFIIQICNLSACCVKGILGNKYVL